MLQTVAAMLVASIVMGAWGGTQPLGTAMTYQGVLKSGSVPFSGSANITVRLYGGSAGGTALAEDVLGSVVITDGLLTVEPDFGSAAFTGAARWIEFEIDGQTLAPRQAVRPTPYALRALTSASSAQWTSNGTTVTNQNTGFVGINRSQTVGLEWFGVHAPVNSGYGGMYVTTEGAGAWPFYGYRTGFGGGTVQQAWTYLDGNTGSYHINVDGNRLTVTDQGMVGIRTTVPAYPLHVVSTNTDRTIHGENSLSTGVGIRGAATNATGANVGVHGSSASTGGFGVFGEALAVSGGNVAVRGHVNSPTAYATYMTGPAGSRNYFERYVGIGTDLPLYPLHAVGTTTARTIYGLNTASSGAGVRGQANHASSANAGVHGESSSTSGRGVIGHATAASGTTFGVQGIANSLAGYAGHFTGRGYFSGNLGLGTLNPANPLSVAGNADITGQVSIGITGADARLLVRGVLGEDAFRVRVEGGTKLLVKDNGGVGIGSNFGAVPDNGLRTLGAVGIGADPGAFTLVSNGDAAKPGGGSWSVFSDARLKHDIQPLQPGTLDRLLSLNGYTFTYDDKAVENRLALPGMQTGLIAQEVQQVFPEWIGQDDEGYLYVTERGLTAIVVEALRELRAEKDDQINELQRRNSALEARLDRLEALLARVSNSHTNERE